MYTSVFAAEIPDIIRELTDTQEMQRLSDIGMHCGCEYTSVPLYAGSRRQYSRLTHSIGVAMIVWNFTHDAIQATAGMLHDIATPVFAHTIDFMNGDHMTQESTEVRTHAHIAESCRILHILQQYHIDIDDVSDYHKYPIADNDTPMLSADRLEYTLGNGFCVHNMPLAEIEEIYYGLAVLINEQGCAELGFISISSALKFAALSMRNSLFYVSNEDRYLMQHLADIIRKAIDSGVLSENDLYTTESDVITKLTANDELSSAWRGYRDITSVTASENKLPDRLCRKVFAKKRYIDPLVKTGDTAKRISEVDGNVKAEIDAFLALNFDCWLYEGLNPAI